MGDFSTAIFEPRIFSVNSSKGYAVDINNTAALIDSTCLDFLKFKLTAKLKCFAVDFDSCLFSTLHTLPFDFGADGV